MLFRSDLCRVCDIVYKEKFLKKVDLSYPKETIQLNKQSFTAIILRPFEGNCNTTMSIFASGSIGITGLKKKDDLTQALNYIYTTLLSKLNISSVHASDNTLDVFNDELFSFT